MLSLDKITENTPCRVISVSLPSGIKNRLSEFGLIPGTELSRQLTAPCGDPCAYLVRGCLIAIRREYAKNITVERISF